MKDNILLTLLKNKIYYLLIYGLISHLTSVILNSESNIQSEHDELKFRFINSRSLYPIWKPPIGFWYSPEEAST